MSTCIEIKNVSKVIKNRKLIDNVSLNIATGRTVGFTGNNGSGKTVLFKLVTGLFVPSEGTITVQGKVVSKEVDFPDSLGFIIETPGFLPHLSGYANLKFLADIKNRIGKAEIIKTMKDVGLDPYEKKHVGKYSLGMRQRLGLAQAIMEDPDILVLDEPFNGLDKGGVYDMRDYLLQLKEAGKTILVASHSGEDIDYLCDEVYEMEKGKITKIR